MSEFDRMIRSLVSTCIEQHSEAVRSIAAATERLAKAMEGKTRFELAAEIAAGIHAGSENCTPETAGKLAVETLDAIEKTIREG